MTSFTTSRAELRRASELLRLITERQSAVPILRCFLIDISANGVEISATDLNTWVTIRIEAEAEGKGKMAIDSERLVGFTNAAENSLMIESKTEGSDRFTIMTSGQIKVRIRDITDPIDWPAPTPFKPVIQWSMPEIAARRLISLSKHCISTEETRYYLNGMFLTTNPKSSALRAVTTDGHRMAVIDSETKISKAPEMIVPEKLCKWLLKAIKPGGNGTAGFQADPDGSKMQIDLDGISITSKTIDGRFPNYAHVVPSNTGGEITRYNISASAVKRMRMILGRDIQRTNQVALDSEGEMRMRIPGGDMITFPLQASGATCVSGYNLRYLFEMGEVIGDFRMETIGANHPSIIHNSDPDAFWVLMSMRI